MFDLQPPRHISTLRKGVIRRSVDDSLTHSGYQYLWGYLAALRKAEEQAPQQRAQRGVADRPARRDVVAAPSRSPPSCRRSASQTEHAELQPDLFQLVVEQDPRGSRFVICRLLLREPGGGIGNG